MFSISGDEEFGLSCKGALEDTIVVVHGCHDRDPLSGFNELGDRADRPDASRGLPFGKTELLLQNAVELGQDERRDEKLQLPAADTIEELVGLAPGKSEGGDQNIGVQDNPHEEGRSLAEGMDESIDILFRLYPQCPGLQGGLLLEFSPAVFREVHPQGLADQLALRSVLFLGRAFCLSDKVGGKRDGPGFAGTHIVTSGMFLT